MIEELKRRIEEAKTAIELAGPRLKSLMKTVLDERKAALDIVLQYAAQTKPYREKESI